jgi:hypothetical protein
MGGTLSLSNKRLSNEAPAMIKLIMSALGQKQTSAHVRVMSALPPKVDID